MKKAKEIEAWEVLHNTLTEDSYTFGYVVNQLPFIKDTKSVAAIFLSFVSVI